MEPLTAPGAPAITLRLRHRRDTARLGRTLAEVLGPGDLLVLEGGLGAGKTCLVKSIVHALGVPKNQPVTSPTFEILHEFQGRLPVIHADLYRLPPSEPLEELGLLSRIGADAVVLIEWGERFADQLGDAGVRVQLTLGRGTERSCALHARAERGTGLIERLKPLLSAAGLTST